jgi:hypothetical protein
VVDGFGLMMVVVRSGWCWQLLVFVCCYSLCHGACKKNSSRKDPKILVSRAETVITSRQSGW